MADAQRDQPKTPAAGKAPQGQPKAPVFGAPATSKDAQGKDFRHIVRMCNADLDGNKSLLQGMRKIRGVNFMFASMACRSTGVDGTQKAGLVLEESIAKIDEFLKNPVAHGAPAWMLNRRKDPETGRDMHLISNDLLLVKDNDIKTMKKIRSYRGVRHMSGLPVRGQRTRSNFRRTKSKGGGGRLGVVRKKEAPPKGDKSSK